MRLTRRGLLAAGAGVGLAGLGIGLGLDLTGDSRAGARPAAGAGPDLAALPGLRELARGGRAYGGQLNSGNLADAAYAAALARECSVVTPGNELKWALVHPQPGRYDFRGADTIMAWAAGARTAVRGHTLVWFRELPPWVESLAPGGAARQVLESHIQAVVGRYAGRINSWDVLNEIADASVRPDGLRESVWLKLLGPDYPVVALRAAHAADPAAELVYNEAGLEMSTPDVRQLRETVLGLLRRLLDVGAPLHTLGLQCHVSALEMRSRVSYDPDSLAAFVLQVRALGLRVRVTELDVSDVGLPADITKRDREVAAAYRALLVPLLDAGVDHVQTWGLSDAFSWLRMHAPRSDGLPVRPLPLDPQLRRKPAWSVLATLLSR